MSTTTTSTTSSVGGQLPGDPDYPPPPRGEHRLPAELVVVTAIALQLLLPKRVTAGPNWLLPALEGALLILLIFVAPQKLTSEHAGRRRLALGTTAIVSIANAISLVLLSRDLLHHNVSNGHELIIAGVLIWLTNVLIFGLWYWEIDRGGPGRRAAGHDDVPDFLYPQMTDERMAPGWRPQFLDYLYVSLTNATAFSPTDTMPLTVTAKSLMGLQSIVSLVTLGLVVSRAVNIL